jgi:hypothetical protein
LTGSREKQTTLFIWSLVCQSISYNYRCATSNFTHPFFPFPFPFLPFFGILSYFNEAWPGLEADHGHLRFCTAAILFSWCYGNLVLSSKKNIDNLPLWIFSRTWKLENTNIAIIFILIYCNFFCVTIVFIVPMNEYDWQTSGW